MTKHRPWLKYFTPLFNWYHYVLKNYSPKLHEKFMTLICPFISLFLKRKKSSKNLPHYVALNLKNSCPFTCYQYVLKINYSSEFHKQVHNFELSIYFTFFFWWGKWETIFLWSIHSKKITAEFHKQIHYFVPFTPSLTNHLSNFTQGYLEEKSSFLSISNWP